MKNNSPLTRRNFVKTTSVAAIGAPLILKSSLLKANGSSAASDKINLGIIGCGGLGKVNLDAAAAHPDIVVTANVVRTFSDHVLPQGQGTLPYLIAQKSCAGQGEQNNQSH